MTPDNYKHDAEAMLKSIAHARSEHLTYDQMDAWVEDQMDQTAREWVVAHIGLCDFCAKQLSAYESYAPVMSGPIAAPAQLIPLGERIREGFKNMGWPQIAMAALVVVVAVLAPIVIRNSRSGLHTESLEVLPPGLRHAAQDVVNANAPLRPVALADLAPNVDPKIEYPASEVIEETQPALRWNPNGAPYKIDIEGDGQRIESEELTATQWTVPVQLHRGIKYSWEIISSGEVHHAWFRVLGASEEQTLADLRASGAGPLALGAVEQQFGLLSPAQHEFEKLAPHDAAKLLDHIHSLRGN
jgi:hypothetical protein